MRQLIKDVPRDQLRSPATRALVAQALGLANSVLRSRRMLQDGAQSQADRTLDRVLNAAEAPAVWDPRDTSTTGGRAYHCPVESQG